MFILPRVVTLPPRDYSSTQKPANTNGTSTTCQTDWRIVVKTETIRFTHRFFDAQFSTSVYCWPNTKCIWNLSLSVRVRVCVLCAIRILVALSEPCVSGCVAFIDGIISSIGPNDTDLVVQIQNVERSEGRRPRTLQSDGSLS